MDKTEILLLRSAYFTLLQLPDLGVRTRLQTVLATLRDEIGALERTEAEAVQHDFETRRAHPINMWKF